MKLGGEYRLKYITRRNWEVLAKDARLKPEDAIDRVKALAGELAEQAGEVARHLKREGVKNSIVPKLGELIATRAATCAKQL